MKRHHILVVDDEPLNLEIIAEFLADEGYLLDLVASAERAWERLEANASYDLAILDRMMPGMSGMDLLKKMKADSRFCAIPVIMQTAACHPQQIKEGFEAGVFYYLSKPFELETLTAIINSALADPAATRLEVIISTP